MITPNELALPEDTKGIRYSIIRAWREMVKKANYHLIQWRDEGTNIGGVGQVNKVNFTGAGVSSAVVDDTLTVTIGGGGGGGLSDGDYGDITVSGGATALTIDADVVTFAKMQNISTARLLGRNTAGTGDIEQITLGTNLSFSGTTLNAAGGSSTEPNIVDSTTARTLVLTDAGNSIEFTNTSAVTVTVPTNASVAFPLYTIIYFIQGNTGQVTTAAAGGVTIEYPDTLKTRKRESVVGIKKLATDTWQFFGDFEATLTYPVWVSATANIPQGAGRYEYEQTITAASVTTSSRILLMLDPASDSDENQAEGVDLLSWTAQPASGSFVLTMQFRELHSGPIKFFYQVL